LDSASAAVPPLFLFSRPASLSLPGEAELETTVLLDMDEAQEAMRKAAAATYRPPGS
jgi:hypothetical protein